MSDTSLEEFRFFISEATKPIGVQLENVTGKLDVIADIVRPIPAQIAKLDVQVEGLNSYKTSHEMKITGLTGKMQNIELTLAQVAPKVVSFWEGPNAKYLLMMGMLVVSGLMGLAGYNVGVIK